MKNLVPASIVVGCSIIAAAVYIGLRASRPDVPATASPTTPAASASTPSGPRAPASATTPTALTDAEVLAAATTAVEQVQASWRAACWDTADPATRKPGRYLAVYSFRPDGVPEIAGITEVRDASDPSVAVCLRRNVHALRIPPPGRKVVAEVPFAIP